MKVGPGVAEWAPLVKSGGTGSPMPVMGDYHSTARLFSWDRLSAELGEMPDGRLNIAYAAPKPHFRPVTDRNVLEGFRRKYDLPERIISTVTRVSHILDRSDSFFPGKYPHATVRAFALARDRIPTTSWSRENAYANFS